MSRLLALSFSLALLSSSALALQARGIVGVRNLALSPDGEQLAFTWRGDVWVVPVGGGRAIPLTNNIEMDDNAVWSPDGKWIAFASNRNGNWDTYLVPSEGGEVRRLTFSSFSEVPSGWSPDGNRIILSTSADAPETGVYSIDVNTGQFREIVLDPLRTGFPKFSPDGREVAYVRAYQFPWSRPRYEGSAAAQLNIFSLSDGKRTELRANRFQHLWPNYAPDGRSLYVVTVTEKTPSTHNVFQAPTRYTENAAKTPNVYRVNRANGQVSRLTEFVGGSGARFLTVAEKSGLVAFERDGTAYTMVPGRAPSPVRISAFIDDKTTVEERLILTTGADSPTLSPKGDKVVFSVRRELWSVPVKKGRGPNADDATQLTTWEGSDVSPIYTPDENIIFFVSDRDGANRLYRMDLRTLNATAVTNNDQEVFRVTLTPDQKHIAYWQAGAKTGGLFTVPVAGGTPKRVIDFPYGEDYAFSPDMKYLAYQRELLGSGFNPWEQKRNIFVLDLSTGKEVNVTNLSVNHSSPAWSADGKYLYFRADRDGGGIFALPLADEAARPTELELKYEKPKETPKLEFNFDRAWERIRRLYTGTVFGNLVPDPTNGALYFNSGGDIWSVNYDGEGARPITTGGGIGRFELSQDSNQLFFTRGGAIQILNLRAQNFPVAGVSFRADWTRDVRAERRAAYREFWRIYNWTFYDPNFHGRNWLEIRERNEPLLDGVGHRNEMATVLNMKVGELEASHAEVGPAAGNPGSQSTAHPGFLFDYTYSGPGIRIKEVPKGTPGSFPQTQLRRGEYVMAINGKDVRLDQNLWRVLNEQTGREITLTVNSTPTKTGARTVKYRALSGGAFDGIVNRNRIEANRDRVAQVSGGKVGYIHIAAMGGGNFRQFDAEIWQQIEGRQGLIIDVRNNNGGNIADQLLDILERRPQMLYLPRDGKLVTGPGSVVTIPIVVMLNERSVSNGEMFPAAMKSRGLATTVGTETPGYVIYTSGGSLVDGTSIRLPGTGVFRTDGTPLENLGEKAQIQVSISPEQFFRGEDPQLQRAIEVTLGKAKR